MTSANTTAFYHDEKCLWHGTAGQYSLFLPTGGWVQPPAGAGLAESPESKRRVVSLLHVSSLRDKVDLIGAAPADETDLLRVHPQSYLEAFREASDNGGGEIGVVAPFGPGSYEIAKQSTGLVIEALDQVISRRYRNAYVMSRPPGHHCLPDTPMGFCLLANIAIGVETMKAKHDLGKVVVLDWDVHHGNGTQHIFYDRDDVLTISIHQEGCFPPGYSGADDRGAGRGEGYNINIPLLPGGGHDAYTYTMERIVVPAIRSYKPDQIVIACGLDANCLDPLARMLAHSGTFRSLADTAIALAHELCDGRIAMIHEGGYAETYVPFCSHAVLEALVGVDSDVTDPTGDMFIQWQPNDRYAAFQRQLIDEMAAN